MKIIYSKPPFSLYVTVDPNPDAVMPIVATDDNTEINNNLVEAVKDHIGSFINSYAIGGEIRQAEEEFGDLLLPPVEGSNIRSVRVNSERFLLEFLTPDMKRMGYSVEAV